MRDVSCGYETSRYNLTVGMAVNEVLSKVLDQLGTAYVSHELTAGKTARLSSIPPSSNCPEPIRLMSLPSPLCQRLTIPVKIINDGKNN